MKLFFPVQVLFVFILSFVVSSCSSDSKEPEASFEGEWVVWDRTFECSDDLIESDVNNLFVNALSVKKGEFRLLMEDEVYIETVSFGDGTGKFVRQRKLEGSYTKEDEVNRIAVFINNVAQVNNWRFNLDMIDLNTKDNLATKQVMTSEDIEKMYLLYFDEIIHLDETVTGTLTSKAWKIKQ